jgi:hypothetical protein
VLLRDDDRGGSNVQVVELKEKDSTYNFTAYGNNRESPTAPLTASSSSGSGWFGPVIGTFHNGLQ